MFTACGIMHRRCCLQAACIKLVVYIIVSMMHGHTNITCIDITLKFKVFSVSREPTRLKLLVMVIPSCSEICVQREISDYPMGTELWLPVNNRILTSLSLYGEFGVVYCIN